MNTDNRSRRACAWWLPAAVAADPSGRYLYVGNQNFTVSGLSIDPATGALTALAGSPYAINIFGTPSVIKADSSGRYVYVAKVTGP